MAKQEEKIEKRKEAVLFLCAHNDDQLIGAGGTIAKYAKEGKKIVTIVFSFGEILLHIGENNSQMLFIPTIHYLLTSN